MTAAGPTIRPMRRSELDIAIEWAASEGWNPGLRDADCFWAQDPEGFLIALVNDQPAAVISIVRYGEDFAFLGFYIAAPAYRKRGVGYALWQAAIAHASNRTIGLDGVIDQQDNYKRSGFALSHRNIRYEGAVPDLERPPHAGEIIALTEKSPDLAMIDERAFGLSRPAFLSSWLTNKGHRAKVLLRDGNPVGYGVSRPCRSGSKIGPLFAPDQAGAQALLIALATDCGAPVILDVPEPNTDAISLAEAAGFVPSFETARMYKGPAPKSVLPVVFGVTTFELG